jgi:hypothetical protein
MSVTISYIWIRQWNWAKHILNLHSKSALWRDILLIEQESTTDFGIVR